MYLIPVPLKDRKKTADLFLARNIRFIIKEINAFVLFEKEQ